MSLKQAKQTASDWTNKGTHVPTPISLRLSFQLNEINRFLPERNTNNNINGQAIRKIICPRRSSSKQYLLGRLAATPFSPCGFSAHTKGVEN
jgi:hypothetical protein